VLCIDCEDENKSENICDEYELDILSDEYVEAYIEQKRNEYHEEYYEFYSWYRKSVGEVYNNVRA